MQFFVEFLQPSFTNKINNKVKILQRFGNVNLLSSICYDKKRKFTLRGCQVGSYKFLPWQRSVCSLIKWKFTLKSWVSNMVWLLPDKQNCITKGSKLKKEKNKFMYI